LVPSFPVSGWQIISRPQPFIIYVHSGGRSSFPLLPQDQMQSDTVAHQTGTDRSSSQQLQLCAALQLRHPSYIFPQHLCVLCCHPWVWNLPASSSHWRLYSAQFTRSTIHFFDLEKAYDTTWKYGIMKDLHDAGLRGRLPLFIKGFLIDRQFQVLLSVIRPRNGSSSRKYPLCYFVWSKDQLNS